MQVTIATPACATPSKPPRSKSAANSRLAAIRSSKAPTGRTLAERRRGSRGSSAGDTYSSRVRVSRRVLLAGGGGVAAVAAARHPGRVRRAARPLPRPCRARPQRRGRCRARRRAGGAGRGRAPVRARRRATRRTGSATRPVSSRGSRSRSWWRCTAPGRTAKVWCDELGLDRFLAASGHRMAVAAVDGGVASYWHERADGQDARRMVREEFLPLLAEQGLDADRPGLLGWSMGGLGVLMLGAELDRDLPVLAVSPALWPSYDQVMTDLAFDDEEQYDECMALARESLVAARGSTAAPVTRSTATSARWSRTPRSSSTTSRAPTTRRTGRAVLPGQLDLAGGPDVSRPSGVVARHRARACSPSGTATSASTPATTAQTARTGEDRVLLRDAGGREQVGVRRAPGLAVADLTRRRERVLLEMGVVAPQPDRGQGRDADQHADHPGDDHEARWPGRARRGAVLDSSAAFTGASARPNPKPHTTSGMFDEKLSSVSSCQVVIAAEAAGGAAPCRPR